MEDMLDFNGLQKLMTKLALLRLTLITGEQIKQGDSDAIHSQLTALIEGEGVSVKGMIWLNQLGEVLIHQGKHDEAYRCFQRALTMGRTLYGSNVNFNVAGTLLWLGIVSTCLLMYEESKFYLEQLLKLLPSSGGRASVMFTKEAHRQLAIICAYTDNHEEAISNLQKSLALAASATSGDFIVDCCMYCTMATSWNNLGAHEKAWQSASNAKDCLRSVVDVQARITLTCSISQTYIQVGKSEEAMLLLKQGLKELDLQPDVELKVQYLNSLGKLCAGQDLAADAERYYKNALDILRTKNGNTFGIVRNLLDISYLLLEDGKLSEATSYVYEAWKYALTVTDNDKKCTFLEKIAECWEKIGENHHARKCFEQALKLCTESVVTPKVPLVECHLHVKLGDLLENAASSVSNTEGISMSTEQVKKAKRMHYDRAGEVLRRHVASGNFNSTTVLLFTLLASKYRSIDLEEQEKLLLEALRISEEIYGSDNVNEAVASVLISLSDVYWDRKDYATASDCLDRSLRMEMEIHSSDPYHPHITHQISSLSGLYLEYPGSEQLKDAMQFVLKFLERDNDEEASSNSAAKANCFAAMAYLFFCLGDFERAETLNQLASGIFATIQKNAGPKDVLLNTGACDMIKKILTIWKANPRILPLVKMAISSGLFASLFHGNNSGTTTPSLIEGIGIGNLLGNRNPTDESNPGRGNTEETSREERSSDISTVSTSTITRKRSHGINIGNEHQHCQSNINIGNDHTASTSNEAVPGDSNVNDESTFLREGSAASAGKEASPSTKIVLTNELLKAITRVKARLQDISLTTEENLPSSSASARSGKASQGDVRQKPALSPEGDIESRRLVVSDSPVCSQGETSDGEDEVRPPQSETKQLLNKNAALCANHEQAEDGVKQSVDQKTFESEILDSLSSVGEAINYDLKQGNLESAGKSMEDSFLPLVTSAFKKAFSDPVQSFINEAVRARENKEMSLMSSFLQLAAKYPSDPGIKAKISKMSGECQLYEQNYRMAALCYTEAVVFYRSSSPASQLDHQVEYAESLIGLTKSHMLCNDMQGAWCACQEGVALISAVEPELTTSQLLVELFYLAAKCTIQLSTHSPTQDHNHEQAVSFCQQALATSEYVDRCSGSGDLIEELSGSERGDFFALKCEIKLLLVTTLCRLEKSDEARNIISEIKEFLGNIVVVLETFSKNTWPGGEVDFFKIRRRIFSWIGRALVMSGEADVAINHLTKSLAAFAVPAPRGTMLPSEEFLTVLDAITATKTVASQVEPSPFQQTLELCKHQFLEQREGLNELQTFFGNLGNLYVDCGRTEEAIVAYEAGLAVADCMEYSDPRNSRGQMLLYLANAHRLQAIKDTGKGAAEERRLAERYYQTDNGTKDSNILKYIMYASFLCEEGRFEEAIPVLEQVTEVGGMLWDKNAILTYSKRDLNGPAVQKYMESHGELFTPMGNLAYSILVGACVGLGIRKEAVVAYEKLSTDGKDVGYTPYGNRPLCLPYLLGSCQKGLLSLIEEQGQLRFDDSDFPLSAGNLAKVYYELGEYELTLEYCKKARMSTGVSQSQDTQSLDSIQSEFSLLRLAGNALVMLERGNESYSYFISFLELLQDQEGILDKPFDEEQVILAQYTFAQPYYVYRSLGMLLGGRGNVDGAIECHEHCLGLDWDYNYDQNLVATLAELYQTNALTEGKDDKATYQKWMDRAQECFQELLRKNKKLTPFIEAAFASFLSRTERLEEAIIHFEEALAGIDTGISFSDADKPLVGVHLAREIQARGHVGLPLKIYVYNQMALTYLNWGKVESAQESALRMEEYATGLASSPHFSLIRSVLGYTYKEIGNERKAAEIFNSVLEMTPDNVPVKLALESCRTTCEEKESNSG